MKDNNFRSILANCNKNCKKSSAWPPVILGLTGGMAAGKSSVARLIKKAGIPVIDADELAREAISPDGTCLSRLVKRLGSHILAADGTLNRRRLLHMIIADAGVKLEVEKIIHPEVLRRLDRILALLGRDGRKMAVVEVPLLFEVGWSEIFDRVICVTAPRKERVRRIMERNGVDRQTAEAWIDLQLDQDEKARRSDFVIVNNDGRDVLEKQVAKVLQVLSSLYPGTLS